VLSARWSGGPRDDRRAVDQRNNDLLLQQLSDVPDERRGAHFASAVAFCAPAEPDGQPYELVVEDRMTGRVIRETRGSGGFGYDVLFCADQFPDRTSAELEPAEKDAISHRGRALRQIAPQIIAALTR
jgi:XTP/dITP diphosphohydrolase